MTLQRSADYVTLKCEPAHSDKRTRRATILIMKFIFNIAAFFFFFSSQLLAQSDPSVFPHLQDGPFWISGQANFIFQAHPGFSADYSGTNSLRPEYEKATSRVVTLYTGVRLSSTFEVQVHLEEAGGAGLSQALGIAGFSNLDAVRNPSLGSKPYLARIMAHKVIALGSEKTESDRGPFRTFDSLPARRIDLRAGKFGTVDFFDLNSVGSDSHLQFCNWAIGQNGAYDFAADTRGYTWGAIAELHDGAQTLRFGEMLMPSVANGMNLVWNLRKAHSENVEYERRHSFFHKQPGTVRVLSYVNHANMGVYSEAIARYEAGNDPVPEITDHAWQTTAKYGFGLNVEQFLTPTVSVYARAGWNNGKTESFAYTEIDNTLSGGVAVSGRRWHRDHDRAGLAFATDGISNDHRAYLADGGMGFILGDGGLDYGREDICEGYYTMHLGRGVYVSPAIQVVDNPGYNRDRGPVMIGSFRTHVEF
jgi:high affinity Mn2+ porin